MSREHAQAVQAGQRQGQALARRNPTRVSLVALGILVTIALTTTALAAPAVGYFVGLGPSGTVKGSIGGGSLVSYSGGTMQFDPAPIGGGDILPTFCTDLRNHVYNGDEYRYEGTLSNCKLVYLVRHYPPRLAGYSPWPDDAPGALPTIKDEMAARQSAVWHYSDGWMPWQPWGSGSRPSCTTYAAGSAERIACRAWEIIEVIDAQSDTCTTDNPYLGVTPISAINPLGSGYFQDFEVELRQGASPVSGKLVTVSLSASNQGTLDDLQGHTSVTNVTVVTDGAGKATFRLWSPDNTAESTSYLTVTAPQMRYPAGVVYINQTRNPGQKLILGEDTYQDLSAEATALWTQGRLIVHKFEDTNLDGDQDPGEADLSYWTFTVIRPDGTTVSGQTDTLGKVGFSLTDTGDYTVIETLKMGWQNTTPLTQVVTVTDVDGTYAVSFGNVRLPVVIMGKCEDLNANGVCDWRDDLPGGTPGVYDYGDTILEPRLAEWHLQLYDQNFATRPGYGGPTNGNGVWIVSNDGSTDYLVAGRTYYSVETLKDGWVASRGSVTITIANLPPGPSGYWHPNYRPASIKACKWNDVDGDGQRDDDEPAVPGWTLYIANNGWSQSALTGDDGCTVFSDLIPGTYHISEETRPGWTRSYPAENSEHIVTVQSGDFEKRLDDAGYPIDFGNYRSQTTLLAFKFYDANQNGVYDGGDTPLADWQLCADGTRCENTNSYGFAVWSDISLGAHPVSEALPEGWGTTTPVVQTGYAYSGLFSGTPGPASTVIAVGNGLYQVEFASQEGNTWAYRVTELQVPPDLSHWDLGIATCVNPDHVIASTPGAEEGGDGSTGFVGIKWDVSSGFTTGLFTFTLDSSYPAGSVEVLAKAGHGWATGSIYGPVCGPMFGNYQQGKIVVVKETVPEDTQQGFEFTPSYGPAFSLKHGESNISDWLAPGVYSVSERVSEGWQLSNVVCSDGSEPTAIDLAPGETVTCTFTNIRLKDLVAHKFHDLDFDGVKDADEPGLYGWLMSLYQGSECQGEPLASALTDLWGDAVFSGLTPGDYSVQETLKEGWQNSTELCQAVVLDSEQAPVVYFGNRRLGSLRVVKSVDWNGITPVPGQTFEVCISGPSYPHGNEEGACQEIGSQGGELVWHNLMPGRYAVTETDPGSQWAVEGSGVEVDVVSDCGEDEPLLGATEDDTGDPCTVSTLISNAHRLGSLKVVKAVNWNSVTPETGKSFEICVSGPSHPATPSCQTVDFDGGELVWNNLIPGSYTVTETDPGSLWTVTISGSPATVSADASQVAVSVTNTHRAAASLQVTKVVNWNGATPNPRQSFQICVKGPSYPVGNEPGACQNVADFDASWQKKLSWSNLIPGNYQVNEIGPAAPWMATGSGVTVSLAAGSQGTATITNTHPAPAPELPLVDLDKGVVNSVTNGETASVVNGVVTFTVRITNTGPTTLTVVPLDDVFTGPVHYLGGTPAPTTVHNQPGGGGHLHWDNLLPAGAKLPPAQALVVTTAFRLLSSEESFTMTNYAQVIGALDENGQEAPPADDEETLSIVPTAIELLYFQAERQGSGVLLSWATAVEIDNYGFRLLRSASGQLNDAVEVAWVPGQGRGRASGGEYAYLDTEILAGQTYTYWLVDVDLNGVETIHPVTATVVIQGGSGHFRTFVPVVVR